MQSPPVPFSACRPAASQYPAHDLPPQAAADGARDRLGGDLYQSVALAATRPVAPKRMSLTTLPVSSPPTSFAARGWAFDRGLGRGAGLEQLVGGFAVDRLS